MSAACRHIDLERLPLWLGKQRPRGYRPSSKVRLGYANPSFNADFLRALGEEVLAFANWVQPTERERLLRQQFSRRVEGIVTRLWPHASVKVFGSSQTGLALPVSDVDFVVEGLCDSPHANSGLLTDLSDALQDQGMASVRVIANAKVPLVKFVDPDTHLCGDISFGVRNAAESVQLVKRYLAEYPAAKPLILVLKTLMRQNNLNLVHTGGLSSYAITLLVVTYLRVYLTTATEAEVAALRELDGVAMGNLFVGFMKYFSSTDLRNHVFTPAKDNPVSISRAAAYPPRGALFVLEDPLDSTNDITRGTFLISQVQLLMWYSLQALARYPVYGHGIPSVLSAVINPRDFHFVSRFAAWEAQEQSEARGD